MQSYFRHFPLFFHIATALFTALSGPVAWANRDKPNVIVIMADDIGFECYGSYGSEYYQTPHIDALAAEGARFTHAYSQPLCTPSRVKIMTGKYNLNNYTTFGELDLSQPTFATIAKKAGYKTAVAGKWQLSPGNLKGPHQAGFDEYMLWHFAQGGDDVDSEFKSKGSRFRSPLLYHNGHKVDGTEDKYGPDLVSDFLCDFIERNKDEPFVAYYPMIHVHNPFDPTPDSPDWDEKMGRSALERFADMVKHMDKTIGKIVAKLEETGLRENTLIMITGDNGTNIAITSPFPGGDIAGGKGSMPDAGTHVAFVANWPGTIAPGTVIDSPIMFSDVLPTVAEVSGASLPEGIEGQSLLPLLKGDDSKARGWAFVSYNRGGGDASFKCFVRDQDWKLYADGRLYNAGEDVLEENIITSPESKPQRERLQAILDNILKQYPKRNIVTEYDSKVAQKAKDKMTQKRTKKTKQKDGKKKEKKKDK